MDDIHGEHGTSGEIDPFHHAEVKTQKSQEEQKCTEEIWQRLDVHDPIISNGTHDRDDLHAHKDKVNGTTRQQKPLCAMQTFKHVPFLDYANNKINDAEPREVGKVVKRRRAGNRRNKAEEEN